MEWCRCAETQLAPGYWSRLLAETLMAGLLNQSALSESIMNNGNATAQSPPVRREHGQVAEHKIGESLPQFRGHSRQAKRHVLIVHRAPWFGGAEKRILDWLGGIDYSRHDVSLAYTVDVFSERMRSLKLPVTCLPLKFEVAGQFWKIFFSSFFYLRQIQPDQIVLVDGYFLEWPLAVVLAAYFVVWRNLYMTEHTPAPEPPRKDYRVHFGFLPGFGLRRRLSLWQLRVRALLARRVVAVSENLKQWVVRTYGYPASKVVVARHGVDTSRFCGAGGAIRKKLRASFGVPEDAVVVVSTARLHVDKRVDRLIKAFAAVALAHSNLWLLLAGDGPQQDEVLGLARSSSMPSRIKFLGWLEEPSSLLQASDIYVLASDFEGFSTALLEAMAAELVCIATKTAEPCEVITDGTNGFLVEPTEAGVEEGIRKALRLSKEEREVFGRRARQQVVEVFSFREGVRRGLAALDIAATDDWTDAAGRD